MRAKFVLHHSRFDRLTIDSFSMKILVALSGGIDSSTVAHLLHAQGHELVGVRFTLWSDPSAPALAEILPSKCCNAQSAARTRFVARQLDIPMHIVSLENEFKRNIVDRFLDDYRNGLTPNPCVGCNRTIKFGKLLEVMKAFGCERIATGHYARVAKEKLSDGRERTLLLEAADRGKDQSYYLYGLTQAQLSSVIFPLGSMQKSDVYALAKTFGVPFDEHYRESQDLCFFPEKTPKEFLRRHLQNALAPGQIVRRDGSVVGSHEGLPLYTIGQRRGLKIGGLKISLEVVAKNPVSNQLIVEDRGKELTRSVRLKELRWVSWRPEGNSPTSFECRTRSLSSRLRGSIIVQKDRGTFTFDRAQPPQAPGQSLVLYRGEEVMGGGTMW